MMVLRGKNLMYIYLYVYTCLNIRISIYISIDLCMYVFVHSYIYKIMYLAPTVRKKMMVLKGKNLQMRKEIMMMMRYVISIILQ
jgi:hypothetical protein